MQYDIHTPIAVFLGPSLARHKAELLLNANYYPPVRMGDVYRLIATGVQAIVIIDGVFHNTTPVWQRELVTAMDSGIAVFGAASMGALRAAELDQLGMIGHGQIYQWYKDSVLDGDDEVALLHTDEGLGYQAMSEPLVNIRYTLGQAVERAVLTASQAAVLLDLAKQRYFGERSYHLLLQSPLVKALPHAQRRQLTELFIDNPINLKQHDAMGVLTYCAELFHAECPLPIQAVSHLPRPVVETAYPAVEVFKRGMLKSEGHLLTVEAVFDVIKKDTSLMAAEHVRCASMFYLSEVASAFDLNPPDPFLSDFASKWTAKHVVGDKASWLRQVGLKPSEFDQLIRTRATHAYLCQIDPELLGFAFTDQRAVVQALALWYAQSMNNGDGDNDQVLVQQQEVLYERAVFGCLVTHWAAQRGISAPQKITEVFIAQWMEREGIDSRDHFLKTVGLTTEQFHLVWSQQAMYQWMLEKGPSYFGYGTYSFPQMLMQDMQVTGRICSVAVQMPQEQAP